MSKRTLREWAAVAEIAGTIAVIVSLLFVAYSIQQNTEQLRLHNSNYLYEQQNSALDTLISQPLLLEAIVKNDEGAQLSATERLLLSTFASQSVNRWEMAFWWHQRGQMSDIDWKDWDQFFRISVATGLRQEDWVEMRSLYSEEFVRHLDQIIGSGN